MESSHALYSLVYSSDFVNNLMTDPNDLLKLNKGRVGFGFLNFTLKRSEKSVLIIFSASSKSF
jgi:hypothetical protein